MTRPQFLARLLLRMIPEPHRTYVVGDLYEEYAEHVLPRRGRVVAELWFLGQTIRTVISFLRHRPRRRERRRWSGPRLSHAYRSWRRRPGFALLASGTLGVGIGAATSVFSGADWILFRPVPGVEDPDRLVMIEFHDAHSSPTGISFPNLHDLAGATPALTHLAAYSALPVQAVSTAFAPVSLVAEVVTGQYFAALGVRPVLGRLIDVPDADGSAESPVVVLSHDLWNRAFGSSPNAVGSTIRLNGQSFAVIGVTPRGFQGVDRMLDVDLWVGGAQYPALRHAPAGLDWSMTARDAAIFHGTVGRMREDVEAETVQTQLRTEMTKIVAAYPRVEGRPTVFEGIGLRPQDRAGVTSIVQVFTAVVLVTLLIACANVANLLVLRGIKRRRELVLRRALGESTPHLYLQHVLEALFLAGPAALLGLMIAEGLNKWFWRAGFLPTGPLPDVAIDWRVATFAVALAVVTALAFSLLPALVASRVTTAAGDTMSRGTPRRVALTQGALTISQLALSLALLTGSFVLVRTISNLRRVDLGFSPEHITVYGLDPGPQGYPGEQNVTFHRDVLEMIREVPGVRASTATYEPFGETINFVQIVPRGRKGDASAVRANWVADEYFQTLDIPIFEGTGFGRTTTEPVVVLSEHTAHDLFGEQSAIDRIVTVASYSGTSDRRVIGVVGDVVGWNPRRSEPGMVYLPLSDMPVARAALLTRTVIPRRDLDRAVSAALARVDRNVPMSAVNAMTERVNMSMAQERSLARIIGLLAILACTLAGVGLYSVIAYTTAERTREFGIRMALGATDRRIVRSVFGRSLLFGIWGTTVGVIASLGLARVIASRVFGVTAVDPASLAIAAATLLVLSVVAAVVPAISALQVDPIERLNAMW